MNSAHYRNNFNGEEKAGDFLQDTRISETFVFLSGFIKCKELWPFLISQVICLSQVTKHWFTAHLMMVN